MRNLGLIPNITIPAISGLPPFSPRFGALVIATFRQDGRVLRRDWTTCDSAGAGLLELIGRTSVEAPVGWNVIEVNYGHSQSNPVHPHALRDVDSGVLGVCLSIGEIPIAALGPTELISSNRTLSRGLEWLLDQVGYDVSALGHGLALTTFEASQLLIKRGLGMQPVHLFRGVPVVSGSYFNRSTVVELADDMSDWLFRNLAVNGRMTYKYWPSKGVESEGDNSIRQAMATISLGRSARRSGSPQKIDAADRNLDFFLSTYYREEGRLGLIVEGRKVKLGAVALGALALLESPRFDSFRDQLRRLMLTIDMLRNKDGSFNTFYAPRERNDCQNFYPGEALFFWAHALRRGLDGVHPHRYLESFRFYREHFRRNPNPAFVPWHTQANFLASEQIDEPELEEFVFEMNDWLLPMQQWSDAPYADLMGRFYNPRKPEYGPPHASATGVYLEGLIDALQLARRWGHVERAEAYRLAIVRGLRNLRQLQYRGPDDMYYVTKTKKVKGAIRTEAYNNEIRVDNVQHGLMAIQKILDRFTEEDFSLMPL